MNVDFTIPSSDPELLERAARLAETFADRYLRDGIIGIVFLGAVVRGYFDSFADIDVVLYKSPGAEIALGSQYIHEDGFEIQCWLADYAEETALTWDMAKRWAFSTRRIYYDPEGLVARLLAEKVPLKPEERRWLMIEGMAQSNWYIDSLPQLWIARGNRISAQHMFAEGLTHFFNALFGLNNELVADVKWRYYCVEQLPILPPRFKERIREVMLVHAFDLADIDRRRRAFMTMWNAILPRIEAEVGMPFDEFAKLV